MKRRTEPSNGVRSKVRTLRPRRHSRHSIPTSTPVTTPRARSGGSATGATFTGSKLIVYTDHAPDYGVIVETSESDSYPMGFHVGSISNEVFQGTPDGKIEGQGFYKGCMQEILIGSSLFIAPSNEEYQVILPGAEPSQDNVAQIMGANPYGNRMHFSIQRMTSGELWYYRYDSNGGVSAPDTAG